MSLKEKKQELQDLREKALADVKDMENGSVDAETREEWIQRNDAIDALAKEVREMEVFESKKKEKKLNGLGKILLALTHNSLLLLGLRTNQSTLIILLLTDPFRLFKT